jgi:FixJ family two-component response regulator
MINLNQIVAVVDDDESVCRSIERLLRAVGVKAETFSSGEEFLSKLSSTAWDQPACVILDFQMPGINGLELQLRLAAVSVPVIFITAHDDPAVREKALASAAAGYLRKPFNGAVLVKTVEIVLGGTPIPIDRSTP